MDNEVYLSSREVSIMKAAIRIAIKVNNATYSKELDNPTYLDANQDLHSILAKAINYTVLRFDTLTETANSFLESNNKLNLQFITPEEKEYLERSIQTSYEIEVGFQYPGRTWSDKEKCLLSILTKLVFSDGFTWKSIHE